MRCHYLIILLVKCEVQYTLDIPSTLYLDNGWELHAEEVPNPEQAIQLSNTNMDNNQVWLDASEIRTPMIVRCRQPGERIQTAWDERPLYKSL